MKKSILGILLALLVLTVTTQAMALLLPLTYSNVDGSGTYGNLQLVQTATNEITVSANYNPAVFTPTARSFGVQDVYLNLVPDAFTGDLNFVQIGIQNNLSKTWTLIGPEQADSLGDFTLNATSGTNSKFSRIPIKPSSEYTSEYTMLFKLTAEGLTESDFLAFSKDNQGNDTSFVAGMHLAGYDANPGSNLGSALAAVPIPGSVWLLGSGLAGLIGICRWKKRK